MALKKPDIIRLMKNKTSVPAPAAAVGYNQLTFSANLGKVDKTKSLARGFDFYPFNFFGSNPNMSSVVSNRDGTLTLNGDPSGPGGTLCTAGQTGAGTFVGRAFGGGGYFEADVLWDPTGSSPDSGGWPSFWLMAIEHLVGMASQEWPGQVPNYDHFIEWDIFESDVNSNAYGGSGHDWSGVWSGNYPTDIRVPYPRPFPTGVDFTKSHKFGGLWVPATDSAPGYVAYYFDRVRIAKRFLWWNKYTGQAPSAPTTVFQPTRTNDLGGFNGYTLRQVIPASQLADRGSGNIRVQFQMGVFAAGTIGAAWIGKRQDQSLNLIGTSDTWNIDGIGNFPTWWDYQVTWLTGQADPFGGSTALKLFEKTVTNDFYEIGQVVTKAASSLTYTISIYAKPAGRNRFVIYAGDSNSAGGTEVVYDLAGGQVGFASPYGTGWSIVASGITTDAFATGVGGNGWYRCWLKVTTDTQTNISITLGLDNGSGTAGLSDQYDGDASKAVLFAGPQLVQGSTLTPYVPSVNPWNFDGSQVQLKFDGQTRVPMQRMDQSEAWSDSCYYMSDPIAFPYSGTDDIVVTVYFENNSGDDVNVERYTSLTGCAGFKKATSNGADAGAAAPSGFALIEADTSYAVQSITVEDLGAYQTFSVMDAQRFPLIIGTGTGWPMTIRSVQVWQASTAKNLTA